MIRQVFQTQNHNMQLTACFLCSLKSWNCLAHTHRSVHGHDVFRINYAPLHQG